MPLHGRMQIRSALKATGVVFVVLLALACSLARWQEVFVGGDVYFLDPDCYSRMTRVAAVLAGEGPFVRVHTFENAPQGIVPHTTAPLDWLIAVPASLTGKVDLAGAFVSPVLGMAFVVGVCLWGWRKPFGLLAGLLAAVSPSLAHAFSVGRPDHQSLLLLLLGVAVAAEIALWEGRKKAAMVSAVAWSLALWVSLFEPLILLLACLALRLFVLRKAGLPGKSDIAAPLTFSVILLIAFFADGWRFAPPSAEASTLFPMWASTIGELKPATLSLIFGWLGWLVPFIPLLLAWGSARGLNRPMLACAALLCFLLMLTFWAARWGPFLVMVAVLVLPTALAVVRWRHLMRVVFVVSLWPVAAVWDAQLFPDSAAAAMREEARMEGPLLREAAGAVQSGPVLAPWWLSPAIAYWTGQPCVGGSSHQSLPGTAETARFFLSETSAEAADILQRRSVSYVITDDPRRLIENSSTILGVSPRSRPMIDRLNHGEPFPFLEPVARNRFFRVFKVISDDATSPQAGTSDR